jgi:thiol-disulfide isomerase/thioredoxin
MLRTLALSLLALPLAAPSLQAADAYTTTPPKCDPSGVCTDAAAPAPARGPKHMWAQSRLYTDAPPLEFQKWLTDKPAMDGKFVAIEFWRTWCGACKRITPVMNALHKKYGSELVIIAVTGETEEQVKSYGGPKLEYYMALDRPLSDKEKAEAKAPPPAAQPAAVPAADEPDQTAVPAADRSGQGKFEAEFGVWGWPHVVILEPQYRTVVWEGYPGLKGYELTEAKIEKMLAIGRVKKEGEGPKPK